MEVSLIIGIIIGFAALLTGFSMEGGSVFSLMLISPFIIVVGGTIGATIGSYTFKDIIQALKSVSKSFKHPNSNTTKLLIDRMLDISTKFTAEGMPALDSAVNSPEFEKDELLLLLKEGIVLIQDGKSVEDIQYVMESELHAYSQQKSVEVGVFDSAAGYSPTMGVIGTVMSLVVVLSNGFGDSAELAAKISTAFIATLYGVGLANLVYLPIANKLKLLMKKSIIQREIIIDGVCMISKGIGSRPMENELAMYYQAFADGQKNFKAGIDN